MGWDSSFEVWLASVEPVPAGSEAIEEFVWAVQDELFRWMTEDAADLPPFYDDRPCEIAFITGHSVKKFEEIEYGKTGEAVGRQVTSCLF